MSEEIQEWGKISRRENSERLNDSSRSIEMNMRIFLPNLETRR